VTSTAVPLATHREFIAAAVDQLVATLERLGDGRINERPALAGANSPSGIVVHCCGVMEWWGGHVIAGRTVSRDREAEFRTVGSVAEITGRLRAQRRQLELDLVDFAADDAPRGGIAPAGQYGRTHPTQGHVLLHIYEELTRHQGQLDLTEDLLMSEPARR